MNLLCVDEYLCRYVHVSLCANGVVVVFKVGVRACRCDPYILDLIVSDSECISACVLVQLNFLCCTVIFVCSF